MPQTRSPNPTKRAAKGGSVFQRKVAGAPVWVWGVGLLSAVLLGLYMRRKRNANIGTATATPTPTTDTGAASGVGMDTASIPPNPIPDAKLSAAYSDLAQEVHNIVDQTNALTDSLNSGALGAGNGTLVTNDSTATQGAQDTTPAHPGQGTVGVISRAHKAVAAPKAKPNTSAGRSHKPPPVKRKPVHPVTSHATHAAPKPHRAVPKPKPKPRRIRGGGQKARQQ